MITKRNKNIEFKTDAICNYVELSRIMREDSTIPQDKHIQSVHGAQAWTLKEQTVHKLQSTQRPMEWAMIGMKETK